MTDSTEDTKHGAPREPGQVAAAKGQGPAPPRPHATLDLKATEIEEPSPDDTGDEPDAAPANAAESGRGSAAQRPAGPKAPSFGVPSAALVLTHLLAGLVGGALVLAVSFGLYPETATNTVDAAAARVRLAEIEERLQSIEATPRGVAPDAALAGKVADLEGRIGALDEVDRAVSALKATQDKLAAEAQALAAKVGREGADAERLRKLEERLALIASAAPGQGSGELPQLAAITGKIAEIETALADAVAGLRKDMAQDIDGRLAGLREAADAAKGAASRLQGDLAALREETGRLNQRADASKADSDRLAARLDAVQGNADRLAASIGDLRGALEAGLKSAAKSGDIAAAVTPVAERLARLEGTVDGVVKSEAERKAGTSRIVLALELANLKRVLDRGRPFASELALVRRAAGGSIDLSALEPFKSQGVPALPDLEREFRDVVHAVLDADAEPPSASVLDRLMAGARSVVRIRKVSHASGDTSTEAVVARMETALRQGRLAGVIEEAKAIPPHAAGPMQDWLDKVKARHATDEAIAAVENELKASLGGAVPADTDAHSRTQ